MDTSNSISIGSGRKISPNEIILLAADNNYSVVHFTNGKLLTVATTLKKLEKRFEANSTFFRTHKSFLINIDYISDFGKNKNEVFVQMKNNVRVVVSRRKMTAFFKRIKNLKN